MSSIRGTTILIAGTHGRSIWIADDITPLQQLTKEVLAKDIHLLANRTATRWQRLSLGRQQTFLSSGVKILNRELVIHFYLKSVPTEKIFIEIQDLLGNRKAPLQVSAKKGLNRIRWDMRFPPSEKEKASFKQRLGKVLQKIDVQLTASTEKENLNSLFGNWEKAESDRELNSIHRQLVSEFAVYSEGHDLFGPSLEPSDAPAGEYRIVLSVGDKVLLGKLRLRDDPLLQK